MAESVKESEFKDNEKEGNVAPGVEMIKWLTSTTHSDSFSFRSLPKPAQLRFYLSVFEVKYIYKDFSVFLSAMLNLNLIAIT